MASSRGKIGLLVAVLAAAIALGADKEAKPPKGDAGRGKSLYGDHCDECHDPNTKEERVGPGLQGIKNGKLPDGRKATHDVLLDIINTGPAEMPSFQKILTEQEKEDVVAYVLTL